MCQLLFIGTTELLLIGGMALLLFRGKDFNVHVSDMDVSVGYRF